MQLPGPRVALQQIAVSAADLLCACATLYVLLPAVPPQQLLGVLAAYRLIYYALPFLLALTLLVGRELWPRRQRLSQSAGWAGRTLGLVAPQAAALLCFAAGLVLLLSSSTLGVALLILARGLYQRLDSARILALWLLAGGIVASLLEGLDWEEAPLLAGVALVLGVTRSQFHRRASLLSSTLSPVWIASVLMAVAASLSISLFS